MIFSVRRPQYLIFHTKSQRLLVTRLRLSCEKVNLYNTEIIITHIIRPLVLYQDFTPSLLTSPIFQIPRTDTKFQPLLPPPTLNIFIPSSLY